MLESGKQDPLRSGHHWVSWTGVWRPIEFQGGFFDLVACLQSRGECWIVVSHWYLLAQEIPKHWNSEMKKVSIFITDQPGMDSLELYKSNGIIVCKFRWVVEEIWTTKGEVCFLLIFSHGVNLPEKDSKCGINLHLQSHYIATFDGAQQMACLHVHITFVRWVVQHLWSY